MKEDTKLSPAEKAVVALAVASLVILGLVIVSDSRHHQDRYLLESCSSCRGQSTLRNVFVSVHEVPPPKATLEASSRLALPSASARLRGIAVLLPGCRRSAFNFWNVGPACSGCHALPEDRRMAASALDRRYVVLAVSKASPAACWDIQRDDDTKGVAQVIVNFRREKKISDNVPVILFGMGSGATIAARLPHFTKIDGVSLSGSSVSPDAFTQGVVMKRAQYPPTVYVRNKLDPRSRHNAHLLLHLLRARGTKTIRMDSNALAITPDFFARRVTGVSTVESDLLVSGMASTGLIDSNGFLTKNPEARDWYTALKYESLGVSSATAATGITEELTAVWGTQESTVDLVGRIFDFFEAGNGV